MKQFITAFLLALFAFSAQAGTTSYFIYDESGHVIGEYDANGNPIQEHIYLGDRPVAVVQGGSNGTVGYVSTDQLNTPRVVTDQNQGVLWSWDSDPFGSGSPAGSLTYNLRFPGQYYDAETGHNYNYYRDYDPSVGRYTESDPIGIERGVNTYAYVSDNPAGFLDPFGLYGLKPGVPPPSAALNVLLNCIEGLLNTQLTITSTTDGQHQDPGHANGTSVDVRPPPGVSSESFFCAAGQCGAVYGVNEGSDGQRTKYTTGNNYHLQLDPPHHAKAPNAIPRDCKPHQCPGSN